MSPNLNSQGGVGDAFGSIKIHYSMDSLFYDLNRQLRLYTAVQYITTDASQFKLFMFEVTGWF